MSFCKEKAQKRRAGAGNDDGAAVHMSDPAGDEKSAPSGWMGIGAAGVVSADGVFVITTGAAVDTDVALT